MRGICFDSLAHVFFSFVKPETLRFAFTCGIESIAKIETNPSVDE